MSIASNAVSFTEELTKHFVACDCYVWQSTILGYASASILYSGCSLSNLIFCGYGMSISLTPVTSCEILM